jgi:hypothetical protein
MFPFMLSLSKHSWFFRQIRGLDVSGQKPVGGFCGDETRQWAKRTEQASTMQGRNLTSDL